MSEEVKKKTSRRDRKAVDLNVKTADGALIRAAASGNTAPLAVPATWFFALTRDEVHSRFVRQTLIELTQ